jgi:hypothetical protein
MKFTTAENINLAEGKSDVILFCERLIECGLFKSGTILPTGFGLRLRRASRGRILRHWIFQYRQHGRTRRMIIGSAHTVTPAQALERARKLHAKVELGGDPQAKKAERRERDSLSLRSVVSDYLAQKTAVKEGTLRMLRAYLEGPLYLKPLHGIPLDRVSRKDIAAPVTRGIKGERRTHGDRIPLSTVEPVRLGNADGPDGTQSRCELVQAADTRVTRPRADGPGAGRDLARTRK